MLTAEEKKKMIDHRIKEYEVRIFDVQMRRAALYAVHEEKAVEDMDERIAGLRKAIEAIRAMEE
jgi:hypothetical protein